MSDLQRVHDGTLCILARGVRQERGSKQRFHI